MPTSNERKMLSSNEALKELMFSANKLGVEAPTVYQVHAECQIIMFVKSWRIILK